MVDKTEKKTDIALKTNKTVYEPREEVTLDIDTKRASEVTVMVVDESLISLMGNIDTNLLEKFYKKLPFQIQTSIGNIAMLKNYYFSRQGIVGGSGFGNFKGGDSAVSSRNIFKNTAYYNASIITSASGKAQVKFTLPDNLTNFRIMALSHSKDNFFGYSETSLEVRKDVIVEDRTPLILREADEVVLGANIFNMTDKEIGFSSTLTIDGAKLLDPSEKKSMIPAGGSEFVTWKVQQTKNCPILSKDCTLPYTISVLGDSVDHSDKISGNIAVKYIPTLIQNVQNSQVFTTGQSKDMTLTLPENTNIEKSFYEFSVSNTPLAGIEDIVKSLAVYPYGCGEQLLSSTLPNAILLKFSTLLGDVGVSQAEIQKNLDYGLSEIYKMQLPSGAMKYWQGDSEGNTSITAYGLRVLLEIQAAGKTVDTKVITSLKTYLEKTYPTATGSEKLEILSSLARLHGKDTSSILKITDLTQGNDIAALNRHELLLLTQALSLADAVKYKAKITEFLALIDAKMISDTQSYWYDDILSDRALQIQILLTLKSDEASIAQKIQSLAARDWQSYWFSTKAKNMSFLAFARYIEIYGNTKQNTVKLTMNGKVSELSIGANGKKVHSISVPLSEVLQENKVALQVQNISGGALFVDATIRSYPQDPLKVKSYSNNIQIKRSIYEVVDETKLTPECTWSETGSYSCTEPG